MIIKTLSTIHKIYKENAIATVKVLLTTEVLRMKSIIVKKIILLMTNGIVKCMPTQLQLENHG